MPGSAVPTSGRPLLYPGVIVLLLALPVFAADPAGEALIGAAKQGDLASVQALLAGGADPDAYDRVNNTALIFAAFKGHLEIARLLLEHGADPATRDQWGRRALDYALRRGPDDPIATLLGAEP